MIGMGLATTVDLTVDLLDIAIITTGFSPNLPGRPPWCHHGRVLDADHTPLSQAIRDLPEHAACERPGTGIALIGLHALLLDHGSFSAKACRR
jgi:hypothetical protein